MALLTVTKFELTVNNEPIDTLSNMLFLKIRVEYQGGVNGIFPGDMVKIEIDNATHDLLKFVGFGHEEVLIYGDDPIGVVGIRRYRNDPNGNYYLEAVFDDGYDKHYGGSQPHNIAGWFEASVYVQYVKEVPQPGTDTDLLIYINGIQIPLKVHVEPGGGPMPIYPPNSGARIGKRWQYGDHSGNLWDLPEVSDNYYLDFEVMRWKIHVGEQLLTWRDLRASFGVNYFTTTQSLTYSNENPTGNRYQSVNEPYIDVYAQAYQGGYPIDDPYLYTNVILEDFLAVGMFNNARVSAHDFIEGTLRIVRILGREENTPWWGNDAFRMLVDSNFLVYDPSEPMDRHLTTLYFNGYRGLTLEEFLTQMHLEGQLLDAATVDDIFTLGYVANGTSPFASDPTDETLIGHFSLRLGNLHFGGTDATVNLIGTDNSTLFANVPAKNLPYAYYIYFDTEAKEAILHNGAFHYFNAVTFKYDYNTLNAGTPNLSIKLEDASGGAGRPTEMRIRKVDEIGNPIPNVKFTLTQTNLIPPRERIAYTTINGTASFTITLGSFTLVEEVPIGSKWKPIAPISFTISSTEDLVNLRDLLAGSGYVNYDDLAFIDNVNVITNHSAEIFDEIEVILTANKHAIGRPLMAGQFNFVVMKGDDVVASGTNDADGEIAFSGITYDKPGIHTYIVKEVLPDETD